MTYNRPAKKKKKKGGWKKWAVMNDLDRRINCQ